MQLDDHGEKLANWLYLGCDLQPGMIVFECNSPSIWRQLNPKLATFR